MKRLSSEPEIRFNTIASTAGAEAITAARAIKPGSIQRGTAKKP
jgi:hypothetical protein